MTIESNTETESAKATVNKDKEGRPMGTGAEAIKDEILGKLDADADSLKLEDPLTVSQKKNRWWTAG